jgi:histidinol-phosphate aminotransferase
VFKTPDDLRKLETYTPGMSSADVAARVGVAADRVVKLGSGENPFGPSPAAVRAVADALARLHQYPEWTSEALRTAVSAREGVEPEQVICGAGETELISAIVRAFAAPGDEILMHRTTFPVYYLYAEAERRTPVFADSVDGPVLDVDDLIAKVTDRTRVVFLTTPHNPSGRIVPLSDVRRVCAAAPHALVVVDEAYIHFSAQPAAVPLLRELPNAIVLRTFSKAYGLASLRVGFGIASTAIVETLLRVIPTWNLGNAQLAGAIAALDDTAHVERTTKAIGAMRTRVAQEIAGIDGLSVMPGSQANFVLVRIDDPTWTSTTLQHTLARHGYVVKDCAASYRGLGDRHLRIDIGADDVMAGLLDRLRDALA